MQSTGPRFDDPKVVARLKEVARQLPEEQAAARRAGLPITAAELRARTRVPDRDNAAPIYRKLTAARSAADTKLLTDALKSRSIGQAKTALERNRERLFLMDQAFAKPGCDFARRWEDGMSIPLPEMAILRDAARLVSLQARVHAAENRPVDALATLERASGLLRHAFVEPSLIGMLVGLALDAILGRAFETVLQSHGGAPGVRARAAATARALETPSNLKLCLSGEAVLSHENLRAIRSGRKKDETPMPAAVRREYCDATEAQILHHLRALAVRPIRTAAELRALQAWDVASAARDSSLAEKDPSLILWAILHPVISPVIGKIVEREERIASRRRLA